MIEHASEAHAAATAATAAEARPRTRARARGEANPADGIQQPLFSAPKTTTPKVPLRDLVLKAIAEIGPVSDDDLIRHMRRPANSVRPRRIELANAGAIVKAEKVKRNGRAVQLWDVPRNVEGQNR